MALLAAADLQLLGEKKSLLIPTSCIGFFFQTAIVSLETPLYDLAVVKNYAA